MILENHFETAFFMRMENNDRLAAPGRSLKFYKNLAGIMMEREHQVIQTICLSITENLPKFKRKYLNASGVSTIINEVIA